MREPRSRIEVRRLESWLGWLPGSVSATLPPRDRSLRDSDDDIRFCESPAVKGDKDRKADSDGLLMRDEEEWFRLLLLLPCRLRVKMFGTDDWADLMNCEPLRMSDAVADRSFCRAFGNRVELDGSRIRAERRRLRSFGAGGDCSSEPRDDAWPIV
jgi:hypothetical protein